MNCSRLSGYSQQRFCWVSISGAGGGASKMHAPENRNAAGTTLGLVRTLLELCWNPAGTLLRSRWNLAGTLLELFWNPVKPCWNLLETVLLVDNAGVDFVFLFYFFLLCLMCRLVILEVWLELCWNCFATRLDLYEDNFKIFFGFCFFLDWSCGPLLKLRCWDLCLNLWRNPLVEPWHEPCRNPLLEPLQECLAGSLVGTFQEAITKIADVA